MAYNVCIKKGKVSLGINFSLEKSSETLKDCVCCWIIHCKKGLKENNMRWGCKIWLFISIFRRRTLGINLSKPFVCSHKLHNVKYIAMGFYYKDKGMNFELKVGEDGRSEIVIPSFFLSFTQKFIEILCPPCGAQSHI